jgi:hypothetical protein
MKTITYLGFTYYLNQTNEKLNFSRKGGTAKQLVYSVIANLITNKGMDVNTINTSWLMGHVNQRVLGYKGIKANLGIQSTTIGRILRDYKRELKNQ